jgi:Mrp family chromosome partitioning ATPase
MANVPEKQYVKGIKKVIGVVSGKGGVGKSTVAVLLAQSLASKGHKVGLMDADITGPSIPRLLGLNGQRGTSDGERLIPLTSEEGLKVLSVNMFMDDEDAPIIWRGPLLGGTLNQFWAESDWGDLDYLVIDFPPSTSDVTLTAFQTIPFAGVFVVATPQDYVSMIVRKSINMAGMLNTPVLGVVENMRSLICPKCGEEIQLFDDGDGLERLGIPLVVSLPWRKEVAQASSLRWAELPEALKADALKMAARAEEAVAPLPSQADTCSAKKGGCECGSQSCCDSCGSAPTKE